MLRTWLFSASISAALITAACEISTPDLVQRDRGDAEALDGGGAALADGGTEVGEPCSRTEQCGAAAYCNLAASKCGTVDVVGVCEPVPEACTEDVEPICGCDGETYANACKAVRAAATVRTRGKCATPDADAALPDTGAPGGGCSSNAQCGLGKYCNSPASQCGARAILGKCETVPTACSDDFEPVCGCNGETYPNACSAASAGVTTRAAGECD